MWVRVSVTFSSIYRPPLSGFRSENEVSMKLSPRHHLVKVNSWLRSAGGYTAVQLVCQQKAFRGTLSSNCPLRPHSRHLMKSRCCRAGNDGNSLHRPELHGIFCVTDTSKKIMCLVYILNLAFVYLTMWNNRDFNNIY